MQGEREKSRDEIEGSGQRQPVGQDSPENEYGEIGETEPRAGSEPRRSGEVDQPASYSEGTGADQSGTEDQGFILQQGTGPNDELQERGSAARATEGNDFAPEGRGALEGEEEDVEGGQSRARKSDLE